MLFYMVYFMSKAIKKFPYVRCFRYDNNTFPFESIAIRKASIKFIRV